jgi:hypothetical protein
MKQLEHEAQSQLPAQTAKLWEAPPYPSFPVEGGAAFLVMPRAFEFRTSSKSTRRILGKLKFDYNAHGRSKLALEVHELAVRLYLLRFALSSGRHAAILTRLGFTPVIQEIFGTEPTLKAGPVPSFPCQFSHQYTRPVLQT